MEEYSMIIGIDNGNSQTKTEHFIYSSGIKRVGSLKPALTQETLYFNNNYYAIIDSREFYRRDKTESVDCFVSTLFGYGKELERINTRGPITHVDLAVGLPPEHFGGLKERFRKYFYSYGNPVEFNYNGFAYKIYLDSVNVFPQAYAALATKPSKLREYSRTYIVDIGGYTVDLLLLSHGKPDLEYCRSLESGMIPMYNRIIAQINNEYDMVLSEDIIQDVLLKKKVILQEKVQREIIDIAKEHADDIINQLRELRVDLKTNPVIFIGGGALLLRPFFEKSSKICLSEFFDDMKANAEGYSILDKALLKHS